MKYGPLKEIWLASYAPFYSFVVYRNRLDAQVNYSLETISDVTMISTIDEVYLDEP